MLEHGFQAGVHFSFFDKLTTSGGLQSLFYGGQEARFFVEIADNNIGHKLFGDGPGFGGDLGDLRLLLGCEVDFHEVRARKNLAGGKGSQNPHTKFRKEREI